MAVHDSPRAIVEKLNAFKDELRGSYHEGTQANKPDLAGNRSHRWKMRVAQYLDAHTSRSEATAFAVLKLDGFVMGDPWENIRELFGMYEAHLDALLAELDTADNVDPA